MAPRMKVETNVKPTVEPTVDSKVTSASTTQKPSAEPKKAPSAPKAKIDVPASQPKPALEPTPTEQKPKAATQTESRAAPEANKVKPEPAAKAATPKRTTQTPKPKIVATSTETTQDNSARNDAATGNSVHYDAHTTKVSVDGQTASEQGQPIATPEQAGSGPKNVGASVSGWVHRTFPGHEHAFVGGMVALVVALLTFAIGPLRVLFICLLVFVGVAVGQIADGDPKIIRMIRGLFDNDRDQG